MTPKYAYPDANDQITAALIKQNEPFEGYWDTNNQQIIQEIKAEIIANAPKRKESWLFDAGCGTGRLLPEFAPLFDRILAVDPDPSQTAKAAMLVKSKGLEEKTVLETASIEQLEWKKGSIDVILCSHVIQHVATASVPNILAKFHQMLRPNGMLFLMTNHSTKKNDYYVRSCLRNSKVAEEKINKAEFNKLVLHADNTLPIHFFSKETIKLMLLECGFELVEIRPFHLMKNSRRRIPTVGEAQLKAAVDLERKFGRDMMVAARQQQRAK